MMSSGYGRAYFTATSKQSTNLASTNSTKLQNFPMPAPSLQEQGTILRGEFTSRAAQMENAFSSLNGRFTAALAEGGSVQQLGNRLNTLEGRVGALNVVKLDADRVNDAVSRVDTIMALVRAGNRSLFQPARPVGDVEEPS